MDYQSRRVYLILTQRHCLADEHNALLPPEREITDQIDIQRKLPFDLFIFELLVHRRFLLMLH